MAMSGHLADTHGITQRLQKVVRARRRCPPHPQMTSTRGSSRLLGIPRPFFFKRIGNPRTCIDEAHRGRTSWRRLSRLAGVRQGKRAIVSTWTHDTDTQVARVLQATDEGHLLNLGHRSACSSALVPRSFAKNASTTNSLFLAEMVSPVMLRKSTCQSAGKSFATSTICLQCCLDDALPSAHNLFRSAARRYAVLSKGSSPGVDCYKIVLSSYLQNLASTALPKEHNLYAEQLPLDQSDKNPKPTLVRACCCARTTTCTEIESGHQ